jgi:hypothetical protein
MISERFLIEVDRRVVGVAVRAAGGFRFYASDPDFAALDGKTFARARSVNHRVAQLARRRRPSTPLAPAIS